MKHICFSKNGKYSTAILIKENALNKKAIQENYLDKLTDLGMDTSECVAFSLSYDKKKPSAAHRKEYLNQLLPSLKKLGVTHILCCDAEYFKTLAKQRVAEPHLGYVHPCGIKDYEYLYVAYGINYQQYFYNPAVEKKTHLALNALVQHKEGNYTLLGSDVLRSVSYPETLKDIKDALANLHKYIYLAIDIEAFSLKHYDAGIGTISFSIDQHTAVAFLVDYVPCDPHEVQVWDNKDKKFKTKIAYGKREENLPVRALLRDFFWSYNGTMMWHNASYDVYVLVYQLWMKDLLDQEGMLTGMDIMLRDIECTKLITYLATNSCAGNKLSLKEQAHAYTGNYAQEEIKDIRLIPAIVLLEYNAIDTCATWYTYHKNHPIMVADQQEELYEGLFKECLVDIIQMQLTGMCLDMDMVHEAHNDIGAIRDQAVTAMMDTSIVNDFTDRMIQEEVATRNTNYVTKVIDKSEAKFVFNPNSGKQLQQLLFTDMGLPVLDLTDTKQPATGGKTLKKLIHHTKNKEYLLVIESLMQFALSDKILSTFINKFLEGPLAPDGMHYVYGNFNLGGTVSGRLSASGGLNLQTIPSGSTFAKIIKKCFVAPPKMVFVGSDFNGLEDVINTLLTRDPNKEKVLIDGFDGHTFRMIHYWKDKFPDLDFKNLVADVVNALKKPWDSLRSESKPVSFALQYQGTWATLMTNCGFSEEEAKAIEANYHELYIVSMQWVFAELEKASKRGYGIGAFGLRIRSPVLAQVVLGNSRTPTEAAAEGRTLGNALSGQSYGLLNGRASKAFMQKVRKSEYRYQIRLCAHIHDAIYLYLPDDLKVIAWVNKQLIEDMAWCELPELYHDQIKLGSELDIFYPSWAEAITLPNGATISEIKEVCINERNKRKN
jgi:DNA polymerase-1